MRNGKWLKAQKLFLQLSPQTANLFNFGKKASFQQKEIRNLPEIRRNEWNNRDC
jgi:hypothetical protein